MLKEKLQRNKLVFGMIFVSLFLINGQSCNYGSFGSSIDFKDFNENPEKYLGKEVTISGKFESFFLTGTDNYKGNFYALKDSQDYLIKFYPKIDRGFELGKTYTVHGVVVMDTDTFLFESKKIYFVKEANEEEIKEIQQGIIKEEQNKIEIKNSENDAINVAKNTIKDRTLDKDYESYNYRLSNILSSGEEWFKITVSDEEINTIKYTFKINKNLDIDAWCIQGEGGKSCQGNKEDNNQLLQLWGH